MSTGAPPLPVDLETAAEAHRRELQAYCYRMLGSLHDAEDAVQETFLRAWRQRATYEGHGSVRAWLYRIATNVCIDAVRRRRRRMLPSEFGPPTRDGTEPPRIVHDVIWLEPFPDSGLDRQADPLAALTLRETISLAFLAMLQTLPPRQRAALILRDVLGFSAADAAGAMSVTVASTNSALHRARRALRDRFPRGRPEFDLHTPDHVQQQLLDRFVRAWESADLDALVQLLTEDVVVTMPPDALWFHDRGAFRDFLASTLFSNDAAGTVRLLPTAANLQPAFGIYLRDAGAHKAQAILVLTTRAGRIAEIHAFMDPTLFPRFGLPSELGASG